MPASYHIDLDRKIVFSEASGHVTDADLLTHQDRLRADPLFQPHFAQMYDLRAVSRVEVSVETVWLLASKNPFGAGSRRATVAGSDLVYGLARMFQSLTDQDRHELRIFRDMAAARQWLGLE